MGREESRDIWCFRAEVLDSPQIVNSSAHHPVCATVWLRLSLACLAFALRIVAQENLALNKPVISSGPNWGSFKPAALSDGDPNTFTHPLADSGTLGFYYQIDLGSFYRF